MKFVFSARKHVKRWRMRKVTSTYHRATIMTSLQDRSVSRFDLTAIADWFPTVCLGYWLILNLNTIWKLYIWQLVSAAWYNFIVIKWIRIITCRVLARCNGIPYFNITIFSVYNVKKIVFKLQGTIAVEFLRQVPDLDAILVATSGGGMISGIATAAKAIKPGIKSEWMYKYANI